MRVLHQNPAPHLKVQRYSPIAQLVERLTVNQNVRGSSPRRGAKLEKPSIRRAFFVGRLLLQYVNIAVFADLMKLRRPHGRTDFAEMSLAKEQHLNA